jgi:hypothetical protein
VESRETRERNEGRMENRGMGAMMDESRTTEEELQGGEGATEWREEKLDSIHQGSKEE